MSSLIKWKIVSALLGLCCVVLVYRVFDQGITHTYLEVSQETSVKHTKLLSNLIESEWLGLPEDRVMSKLNNYAASQPPGSVVLKREPDEGAIYLEGVRFYFRDKKLIKVE
ncbi:Imm58 family immunity protein [Ralstonia solanacearum]|uniref:Imm58 family immunity protein n=1 Tax=Ralstonia solanacearum TaxID=305 RepID=UPI001E430FFA|nr:Imm58 family immunity protein [Ralstonia solanacearum]